MKYLMSKLIKVNIKYYLTAFLVTAVLLVPNIIFGQGPDVYNLDFVDLVKPQNFSRTITLLITMASLGLIPFLDFDHIIFEDGHCVEFDATSNRDGSIATKLGDCIIGIVYYHFCDDTDLE